MGYVPTCKLKPPCKQKIVGWEGDSCQTINSVKCFEAERAESNSSWHGNRSFNIFQISKKLPDQALVFKACKPMQIRQPKLSL